MKKALIYTMIGTAVIAMFWVVYAQVCGDVPKMNFLPSCWFFGLELLPVSRWTDVFVGPLVGLQVYRAFFIKRQENEEKKSFLKRYILVMVVVTNVTMVMAIVLIIKNSLLGAWLFSLVAIGGMKVILYVVFKITRK